MNLNHIEYFIAIAEEKNLSRAADKLFVTQPTLSQYILRLEQDLGVSLFNRTKNAFTLTYAGKIYLESAKEILRIQMQTDTIIGDIIDFKKGHLTVGIPRDRGFTLIPYVFPKFHKKYPGIKLEFVEDNTNNLEALTLQGHIDFSLLVYYENRNMLDYEILCHEEFILAVPKSHRLAYLAENGAHGERAQIDISLFKEDSFILMTRGTRTRQMSDKIFSDAGFEPNVILEISSINTLQSTAAESSALLLAPERCINYRAIGDRLVYFSIDPEKYFWPVTVTYRKGSIPTRATKDFISMVKTYLNLMPVSLV